MRLTAELWLDELPEDVAAAVRPARATDELLEVLVTRGLLPRYAFPVDVVALWKDRPWRQADSEEVQRDLQIALSEYAPGAEVVIDGYKYTCVGLYAPFDDTPSYRPEGWYFECRHCHAVHYEQTPDGSGPTLAECPTCRQPIVNRLLEGPYPAIRPLGFCTDWSSTAEKYRGGGRERAGFSRPARLQPGEQADFGRSLFEERLYAHSRTGDLFVMNRGPDPLRPGFDICTRCGRALNAAGSHRRPTDAGFTGARAGTACSGQSSRTVLIHRFQSDVALFGVNLPQELDASVTEQAGRAAWHSLGAAMVRAASVHLQIDPDELAVGIRAWPRGHRLHAEVFLYDTLPNGAGYAQECIEEVAGILDLARELCDHCPAGCDAACYECLLDYTNQPLHRDLNRHLAADLLGFVLAGTIPALTGNRQRRALESFFRVLPRDYQYEFDSSVNGVELPGVVTTPNGVKSALHPTHSLRGDAFELRQQLTAETGMNVFTFSEFDLLHRPLTVWRELL
jgi:hypothetical protein